MYIDGMKPTKNLTLNKPSNRLLQKRNSSLCLGKYPHARLQFGFQPEISIAEPIWTLQSVIEDLNQHNKEIHIAYLDFKKAYDRVEWKQMIHVLEYYNIPKQVIHTVSNILSMRELLHA